VSYITLVKIKIPFQCELHHTGFNSLSAIFPRVLEIVESTFPASPSLGKFLFKETVMKMQRRSAVAAALAILAYGATEPKAALAAGAVLNAATTAQSAATLAYWTPDRLASAKPKHITTARTLSPASGVGLATGPTTLVLGAPPTIEYDSAWAEKLLKLSDATSSTNEVSPTAVGTTGPLYPYTIDRLYPCAGSGCPTTSSSYSNVFNFYPYATVGQLFFTEPAGTLSALHRSSASTSLQRLAIACLTATATSIAIGYSYRLITPGSRHLAGGVGHGSS
jgi:hypothetical protein